MSRYGTCYNGSEYWVYWSWNVICQHSLFSICAAYPYGSGWTWSKTRSTSSISTSRTRWTRACPSWASAWWMPARCPSTSWPKTHHPVSCSMPRTSPSTRSGLLGESYSRYRALTDMCITIQACIVSWEPEGRYCCVKMFYWVPEDCYCHRRTLLKF